jgi:hypothetical protein
MARELIGYVGVDSGQVMVGDPCYLDTFINDDYCTSSDTPGEYSYSGASDVSMSGGGVIGQFPQLGGKAGRAVVSATRHGDGVYPVFQVVNKWGEVTGLFIDFK